MVGVNSYATHIVGGEMYLTYRSTNTYSMGVVLYFDAINGSAAANDIRLQINVYRKRDNRLMDIFEAPRTTDNVIAYNNPACAIGSQVQTRRIFYEISVVLLPSLYNDSQGYYAVWERCCRNNVINNIVNPGAVGNTFYLEFPAVTATNGSLFVNSSPIFPTITGDYACLNEPFRFDFSGVDADGDLLLYTLVTPLAGNSSPARPGGVQGGVVDNINQPGPNYPLVQWATSFGINNIIPGTDPVKVNAQTGQISFTANREGLFVFSVLVEEFRNGRKIGAVQRDFQIKVLNCPKNQAPSIKLKDNKTNRITTQNALIRVAATDDRCFDLVLNDNFTGTNLTSSQLNIRVNRTNFPTNLISISPASGTVRTNTDTLRAKLCWDNCALNPPGQPFRLELLVSDQGCPFPQTDTVKIQFDFEEKPNLLSAATTNLAGNQATVIAGSNLTFEVFGSNPDKDSVTLEAIGRDFTLGNTGMLFANVSGTDMLRSTFRWNPDCQIQQGRLYLIDFIVKERRCGKITADTITVTLDFKARPSRQPEISTTLLNNTAEAFAGETIKFDIIASDPDSDPIIINAMGRNFKLPDVKMEYESPKAGVGQPPLRVPFTWTIPCDALGQIEDDKFVIDFVVEDNSCLPQRFDTTTVTLFIKDVTSTFEIFLPDNVFTPNGDSANQVYTMPALPVDNCEDQFDRIEIYNRWGKLVFESKDRFFVWEGKNFPAGSYIYTVFYQKRRYKGWVSIIK
ncbi:MAG: gliding motility-associated C-terminal domain-containing protein [Verrucomicrobia bacterium]|nr:gliding motility-associated C-terminal domain-containing protein [Cytophagales bacterium]